MKDFDFPTESWEQAAQSPAKWHSINRKGADQYEAKRVYDAEERLNNTKTEPRDYHQSLYSQSLLALLATNSLELKLA